MTPEFVRDRDELLVRVARCAVMLACGACARVCLRELTRARLAHVSQAREAALAVAVAELEAVYTSTPSDAQSLRLSGACRDQLSLLRHGVDAFELAAADEAEEAATEELRQRRAAFDRRVRLCACLHSRPPLTRGPRDAGCASSCATRNWRRTRLRAMPLRARCGRLFRLTAATFCDTDCEASATNAC
jgi:hypothetical protein